MTAPLKHTPQPPIDPQKAIAAAKICAALQRCGEATRAAMRDMPAVAIIEVAEALQRIDANRLAEELRDEALRQYHHETTLTPREISIALTRYHGSAWRFDRRAQVLPESLRNRPGKWLWYALKFVDRILAERTIRQKISNIRRQ